VLHQFDDTDISLNLNLNASGTVAVDLQEFQQVLVNLISNAIDAVGSDGKITVTTGSDDSYVWLEVEDDGVGIADEDLQRVFDPFFTQGKERGTGLGLSVSYGIVSRYGGQIDVESKPSKGTRFTVVFPAYEAVRKDAGAAAKNLESA